MNLDPQREALAALCHRQWSGWMEYLFSKGTLNADGSWTMPPKYVVRWARQMNTAYQDLSPEEQDSDRSEADKFIALLSQQEPTQDTLHSALDWLAHLHHGVGKDGTDDISSAEWEAALAAAEEALLTH